MFLAGVLMLGAGTFSATRAQPGHLGERPVYDGPGKAFERGSSPLVGAPGITVSAGPVATVSFETPEAIPPCACAYGVLLAEQQLRIPRYCLMVGENSSGDTLRTEHVIRLDLRALQREPCDVDGTMAANGGGTVYFELQVHDPDRLLQVPLPFRFAYRDTARVPCVVDGPWFDIASSHEAVVAWGTDIPAGGILRYSLTGMFGSDPEGPEEISFAAGHRQQITVPGLSAGVECEYWICLDDPGGYPDPICEGPYSFTMPHSDETFLFAVMGDSRTGRGSGEERANGVNLATVRRFCQDAYTRGAGFVAFTGDFCDGFTTDPAILCSQVQTWKRGAEVVGHLIPFYELIGNHDACLHAYHDPNENVYFDREGAESAEAIFDSLFYNPGNGPLPEGPQAPPYGSTAYSFQWARSLFVALNTHYWYCRHPEDLGGNLPGYIMDGQLAWLEQVLDDAAVDASVDHVFILLHHPVFPCAGHTGDSMWYHGGDSATNRNLNGDPLDRTYVVARRDEFWRALCECGKVRAVFPSHEHNYSRLLITAETPVYADNAANPDFTNPIWQCVSGGCGAMYYTQDPVPWSNDVAAFNVQKHYLLVGVSGADVALFAMSDAMQEIDGCLLWEGGHATGRRTTLDDWQMHCGDAGLPFRIEKVWPQPGQGSVSLLYRSLCNCFLRAKVHDIEGRRISTLFEGVTTPGLHQLLWNGRDSKGHAVASGVYFCRLSDPRQRELTKRIILVR
jgi:3',5'-cyclic AMP phosphodiesterase CpdA